MKIIKDGPTLLEIAREEWLEEECFQCGETREDCVCPSGCSCDGEDD